MIGIVEADGFSLRLATAGCATEVAQLLHDFNTEFDVPSPGVQVLSDRLYDLLQSPATFAVVAGDPPIAVGLVTLRSNVWYPGPVALLDELYVEPEQRGRGVGSAVVEHVITEARSREAVLIEVNVDEGDDGARRFYERHGFSSGDRATGETALYYEREIG